MDFGGTTEPTERLYLCVLCICIGVMSRHQAKKKGRHFCLRNKNDEIEFNIKFIFLRRNYISIIKFILI